MTYKENITAILECNFAGFKQEIIDSAVNSILALSENKEEPTDEEVIEYCNKRGYVICTQAVMNDPKREQHRIRFEGYVGVNGDEVREVSE